MSTTMITMTCYKRSGLVVRVGARFAWWKISLIECLWSRQKFFPVRFLLSHFDSRSYISPVERKREERTPCILPTWCLIQQATTDSLILSTSSFLFGLESSLSLSLSDSDDDWIHRARMMIDWHRQREGKLNSVCAPLRGRRL